MNTKKCIQLEEKVILNTYSRPDFVLTRGKGVYVYDKENKKYLDFCAGIAVNALGHCEKTSVKILKKQAEKLWHCSNLYYSEPQIRVAELLTRITFADKVFFCNSGAEAVEGALKIARKWAHSVKDKNAHQIISFHQAFHGRTFGALSATGQPKFWEGFEPLVPGFVYATFNDLDSVKKHITPHTCAIIAEPVQGESGIFPAQKAFLQGLRKLCDENNCLLIFDEIQCGLGRTGSFCAYEHSGIEPDIMTMAKPIAGGLPMGTILMKDHIAEHTKVGNHGSTFGGGPLVSRVAEHVIKTIADKDFLVRVKKTGQYLKDQLSQIKSDKITAIRGKGLIVGVELNQDPQKIIQSCVLNGLLICKAGNNTIRFLPPLTVKKRHIDNAIGIFQRSLKG